MKIILDNDGTITDFNKFVEENAIKYFEEKYGMRVVYPNKLEIEDIFDMKNFFINNGYDDVNSEKKVKEVLDDFWVSYKFIKFSLLNRFRPGVKEFINKKIHEGHTIEIHTSRAKTCQNNLVGKIARKFTIWQYRLNGINLPLDHFYFYENDEQKINGVMNSNPDLVFEDKPEIINRLVENGIRIMCVNGKHNRNVNITKNCIKIDDFKQPLLQQKIEEIVGIKNLKYYEKTVKSDKFFKKITFLRPVILKTFNPIIVNEENIKNTKYESTVYAPNHRSTLDPLVITGILKLNIHWAALLRFFAGKDSIFNNSKNPILCKITSYTFKKLEYFPIDRKSDNPNANNFTSIKDMTNFLKINENIGIFGEGTTRRPEGQDFGTFDDAFLLLAKKTNAVVRPITTLWIKDLKMKQKVIINFGEPFKIGDLSIEEAMEHFMTIQRNCLKQNETIKNELIEKSNSKILKKTLF